MQDNKACLIRRRFVPWGRGITGEAYLYRRRQAGGCPSILSPPKHDRARLRFIYYTRTHIKETLLLHPLHIKETQLLRIHSTAHIHSTHSPGDPRYELYRTTRSFEQTQTEHLHITDPRYQRHDRLVQVRSCGISSLVSL